jgi:hypothetical protein
MSTSAPHPATSAVRCSGWHAAGEGGGRGRPTSAAARRAERAGTLRRPDLEELRRRDDAAPAGGAARPLELAEPLERIMRMFESEPMQTGIPRARTAPTGESRRRDRPRSWAGADAGVGLREQVELAPVRMCGGRSCAPSAAGFAEELGSVGVRARRGIPRSAAARRHGCGARSPRRRHSDRISSHAREQARTEGATPTATPARVGFPPLPGTRRRTAAGRSRPPRS